MKTFAPFFRKMVLGIVKKHCLEKVFATRFQNVEKPFKTNGKCGFSKAKTRCGNPYKTCWILRLWVPFFEIDPQNDKKIIT